MSLACEPRKNARVVVAVLAAVAIGAPCGAGTNAVSLLRDLLVRENLSKVERTSQLEAHLKELSKADFKAFLIEADTANGLFRGEEDRDLSMFFYARWYLEGPGKGDGLLDNTALAADKSLPWRWRWALLDILKPEEKSDISGADMSAILSLLRSTASDAGNHDELRYSAMEKAGSLLLTQAEWVEQRVPGAKPMIMTHDDAILRAEQLAGNPSMQGKASALLREVAHFSSDLDAVVQAGGSQKLRTQIATLKSNWRARMLHNGGGN